MADRADPETLDKSLPLSEAVYRALCQALMDGAYRPGDRLREEAVARRLKVSRTPVREALGRLVARGFVQPAGGRGLIVRSLEPAEVLELYAMREILEGAAARLAAQHAAPAELAALGDLQAAFAAERTPAELARLNRRFHDAVGRAARNRYLDAALQQLQDGIALLGPTTFGVGGRPERAVVEHAEIAAAIAARDPDRAERAARAHIGEALRARLRLVQG